MESKTYARDNINWSDSAFKLFWRLRKEQEPQTTALFLWNDEMNLHFNSSNKDEAGYPWDFTAYPDFTILSFNSSELWRFLLQSFPLANEVLVTNI